MINFTLSLNSKNRKIFYILCCFCLVAVVYLICSFMMSTQNGKTNEDRIRFINSLEVSVITVPSEVKTVKIPYEFDDVYVNYNNIQKAAGYDLFSFRGKEVVLYTYALMDKDFVADVHLLVFKGEIIGGDICGRAFGSQMLPLSKDSAKFFKKE